MTNCNFMHSVVNYIEVGRWWSVLGWPFKGSLVMKMFVLS
uniref:Uncharacterized protein n=1 Tax=Anguilla anguilla TaxID=7936 RepID=A0A0E9T5D3_ANGAN